MRPVDDKFEVSQEFGSMATGGVAANSNPNSGTGYYVYLYGDYQPFGHAGCDFACPIGTPIYAIADGTVLYAGWSDDLPGDDSWGPRGYFRRWALYKLFPGIVTVIQHNGWISVTAHQSDNSAVRVGQHVKEGQIIGKSGNTSSRTGRLAAHVHVEALVDLNYPTGGGLIYGRTNPRKFFGTRVTPQGKITEIKEWDELASKQDIMDAINAELRTPRTQQLIKDAVSAELGAVRTVKKLQTAIWTQVGGTRDGKLVSMWRDVVDTNTILRSVLATMQDLAKKPTTGASAPSAAEVVDELIKRVK